jgi:nucleoid-associated protein EbfC
VEHDYTAQAQRMLDELPAMLRGFEEAITAWSGQDFTGSSDEGRIIATVNAAKLLKELQIDIRAKRELDNLTLGDRIVEAIKAAEDAAEQARLGVFKGLEFGGVSLNELMDKGPIAALPEDRDI